MAGLMDAPTSDLIRVKCEKCGLVLHLTDGPRLFVPQGGPVELDGKEARCPAHSNVYWLWAEAAPAEGAQP